MQIYTFLCFSGVVYLGQQCQAKILEGRKDTLAPSINRVITAKMRLSHCKLCDVVHPCVEGYRPSGTSTSLGF